MEGLQSRPLAHPTEAPFVTTRNDAPELMTTYSALGGKGGMESVPPEGFHLRPHANTHVYGLATLDTEVTSWQWLISIWHSQGSSLESHIIQYSPPTWF